MPTQLQQNFNPMYKSLFLQVLCLLSDDTDNLLHPEGFEFLPTEDWVGNSCCPRGPDVWGGGRWRAGLRGMWGHGYAANQLHEGKFMFKKYKIDTQSFIACKISLGHLILLSGTRCKWMVGLGWQYPHPKCQSSKLVQQQTAIRSQRLPWWQSEQNHWICNHTTGIRNPIIKS